MARGLINLGSLYHDRSRDAGAEELYRRAADIFARSLGDNRVETLLTRSELADVLRAEHRYVEAETLSRATLAPLQQMLRPGDPRLARVLFHRAQLLRETQRKGEAEVILERLQSFR